MATVTSILTTAFRRANILNEIETPSAGQGSQGLALLNKQLAQLSADGLDVGAVPLTAQADEVTASIAIIDAIETVMMFRLAADFGVPLSPVLIALYKEADDFIQRQSLNITELGGVVPTTRDAFNISDG